MALTILTSLLTGAAAVAVLMLAGHLAGKILGRLLIGK